MACLVLLLAVCITAATCNGEGVNSFSEVFQQMFRDGQSDNCDVRKYEKVTGFQLDSCYVAPIYGLVPDDTICDFRAGYMTRTQYCGRGFWFTVQDHPHYHNIMKREVGAIKQIVKKYNENQADEADKIDISTTPTSSTSTTWTTPVADSGEPSADGWDKCLTDPIIVTPGPGVTDVDLKDYFDVPSKTESGWEVTLLDNSAKWVLKDGEKLTASAATYNGITKTLTYRATDGESGNKDHCILKFEFEVKMCDVSNIKSHANSTNANVACDNKFWGIHGERCNMTCKGVDQSMNAENKNVHVTCETNEEDNAEWIWYAEDDESGDAPEAIEPPDCEPIVCRQDAFHANEYEDSLLECQDSETGDYAAVGAVDDVSAGSYCRRPCMDKGGEVCGDMEDAARELSTYNHYTCSYNGKWIGEEPAKCGSNNVWQNCTDTMSLIMNNGKMCCSGDRCTVTCNEGFSPDRGSKPDAVCRQDETDGVYKWQRCEDDTDVCEVLDEFPGEMCKASCGSLPYDMTNMETDSVTPDCSGTEVGGRCNINCSHYSFLHGSSYATCEFNSEDHSTDWHIPEGMEEPRCEDQPCEDLVAPDDGTVSCTYDWEDGVNMCNVTCDEGFTHNLRYKTEFQCDTYETGNWPDKEDIPKCVEASVPEVNLTFKANLEANSDTCNRLSHFVNIDNLTDSVLSQCPSSCNCTPGDLKPSYMGDNECLVELPVTLEGGGYGLAKKIAMLWSMMHVPGALNEDITITKYPSITDIKETCSEGWSLHTQEGADPVCIMCNKGTAYDESTHECKKCDSGNSVDGICVDYAATEPDPVKCEKVDKKRRDLKFTNCSTSLTDDEGYIFETYCMIECEEHHYLTVYHGMDMNTYGPVFAWCTTDEDDEEEGKWQYTEEDFSCDASQCSMGQFSDSGHEPCEECEIGTFNDIEGSTECRECPEGLVAPQRGSVQCVSNDSVTCYPGHYLDDSLECQKCPFSGYCEDGISWQSCPDKMVTEEEGSFYVGDCKNDTWRVIGENPEDPNERRVTVSGLTGLPNLAFMEFRMCRFSYDLRVEFNISPYRFRIDGNGEFDYTDSNNMVCRGNDFFEYSYTECGTNVTISLNEFNIDLNYGGDSVLCWPAGGGNLIPIDGGLDRMTITVSSRDARDMQEVPVHDVPHFAYMSLYQKSDIEESDDGSDSYPGDSSSGTFDYGFGSMPPDDGYTGDEDYSNDYPSGPPPSGYLSGTSPDGSWTPDNYSSGYESGMPPSGSWTPGDYSSGYETGMPPSGYETGMPPSGYETGMPPSGFESGIPPGGSWTPEDYSSGYESGMSSSYPTSSTSSTSSSTTSPTSSTPTTSWSPEDYSESTTSGGMGPTGMMKRRKRGVLSTTTEYGSSPTSSPASSTSSTSSTHPTSSTSPTTASTSPTSSQTTSSTTPSSTTSWESTSSTSSSTSSPTSSTSTPYSSTTSFETTTTISTTGSSTTETTPFTTTTTESYDDYESGSYYGTSGGSSDYAYGSSSGSSDYGYGSNSGDYGSTRHTPNRNCFDNMMNNAHFSDRDASEKPYSCRLKDCESGNSKPDRWTCKPCALGRYYNHSSEQCVACPNYGVTRKDGATEVEKCHGDGWSVGLASDSSPSAEITGLVLSGFCSLKFHVHKPKEPLNFNIAFHQYRLEVYDDFTFGMYLRDDLIIDGLGDNLFGEEDGWLALKISFDDATSELVFEFGDREMRSFSLTVDFEIPENVKIDFNIQVTSDIPYALLYLAYLQVFEDCDRTDDCRANALADSWDYLEGSGISNNQPYSCPDTAEHWSCKEPREIFGNQYMMKFACTDGRSLYSECNVSCTDGYYLHGDGHIRCKSTHWEFGVLTRGVPQCKMEIPVLPTCREPELPDNVMWTEIPGVGVSVPECIDPEYEFRRGGYDQSTVYMCDNGTLKWEPSTDQIPDCFKAESQKPSMAAEFEIYNPKKLSCEEERKILYDVMQSREVTVNSPIGWNAKLEISKLHCGALEGANTEAAAEDEDDPEIMNIRENSDCDECDHDCYDKMWTDMLNRVNSGIESNVNQVFEKLPEMTAASSDGNPEKVEEVAQELTELADQSNKLLDDNGLKEFIEEVELKSDSCSDYEAKKKFGILSNNINETVSNLTKTVKSNAQAVDQRAQSFGAPASGRTMKVDAMLTVSLSESDWTDVQQTTEMQKEFARSLNESGQTVVSDSSKTDVTCGEGKVIASKGQCETKSCLNDETKDENGECKKCNKWTSIIDETGQCVPCRDNERVRETKDGKRACTEPCPVGTASTEGFTDPNTRECTPCEPGEYQDNVGSQQCQQCPGIQTNFETESTSCTPDYDLCLTNTREDPIVMKYLNRDAELAELTVSVMLKKSTEEIRFGVEFGSHTATLDDTGVTLCGEDGEDCAVFEYSAGSNADFNEFTQMAFVIGNGDRDVYIDGVALTSEDSSYTGEFAIPASSDFNTYGSACITNWFVSGEIDDTGDLSSRDGIAKDSNLFRDSNLEAEEYGSSQATSKPSAYTGQPTDYCSNNPCKNGGSCSRAIGRRKCTCPTGYEGLNCEKKFDVQEPSWSDWRNGTCSVTCGEGTLTQGRTCQVEPCTGDDSRTVPCTEQACKVCPTLDFDDTKVSANTSEDGSKVEFYCSGTGQKFAKIDGTKSPNTIFECRPDTDYEWEPSMITPQCATTKIASTYTKTHAITFADPLVLGHIPCDLTNRAQWETNFIAGLATKIYCLNASNLHACTGSIIDVTKCNTRRKKRATSGGDVVLEFKLELDDQAQLDLQNMYDNNIVSSESLLEVVQALANLDNVVGNLQSLTVTINNVNYTVDPASVTSTTSVECQTGQYADGTDCVNCGAGTYQDTTTNFCVQCPKGEYQDQEAMTSCNSCPDGLTTENTGSTAESHCNITVTTNTSCSGSSCGGSGGGDKEDGGGSDGKTIGIAVGAAVGGLVLIGGAAAVIFRAYAASKAKSANLPNYNQNLIHPKNPQVPEKKKLYDEIVNPHFVPPPKPAQADYSQPNGPLDKPPNYEYLTVGQPDARAVTPPGTVMQ